MTPEISPSDAPQTSSKSIQRNQWSTLHHPSAPGICVSLRFVHNRKKGWILPLCPGATLSLSSTWDEWLIFALKPLFAALDRLLKTPSFANWFFERTKTYENVQQTLRNIYTNPDRVDEELVMDILRPADVCCM